VSKPGKLYFILYPWGTTEEELVEQFEADWGVDVEMLVESVNEPVYTKSNTMYVTGEQLDTIKTTFNWLAEWVEAGLLEPLDGLPGLDEYKKDMNDLCLQSAEFQGKTWGLPYYQTFFIAAHFEDHFDAGGIEAPPKTYDELVDQALKLKKDGVAEYPILWMGGMGTQHIMFIYFVLVHNWGGTVFDKDAKLTLGPGSKAREALAWWQKTFQEWKISAPESLELRFIPATKAFWTEKYSYLMFVHHYYMSMLNSEVESPIVGRAHNWLLPNGGATLGYTDLYTMCSTTGSKEWAWMLLQYLGGKTKDGQYTIAKKYAIKSMLGTGFDVVNKDPAVLELWRKWTDVDLNLQQGNLATAMPVAAPAVMRPWYGKWQDAGQVSIQKCLTGEITADEACDEMIAKHEEVAG
jgi:multiple sugar transport system substrate-binding protein